MRYLPLTKDDRQDMLRAIGVKAVSDLYKDVPVAARMTALPDLPMQQGELEVERAMAGYANQNRAAGAGPFFLGAGCYYHHVPASVDYIIQRSEFLTAYTPYQPEIAQGSLQMIFEFQTMIAQLTGMEVANASMYDGATACAEAALMAMRLTGRKKVVIATPIHPHYEEVLQSYLGNLDGATEAAGEPDDQTACVIVQSPDFFGNPHAYDDVPQTMRCDGREADCGCHGNFVAWAAACPARPISSAGKHSRLGLRCRMAGRILGSLRAARNICARCRGACAGRRSMRMVSRPSS